MRRKEWLVLAGLIAWPGAARAFHDQDVQVGVTADRVLGGIVVQDVPQPLPPFHAFGLNGWLLNEPGYAALTEPDGNLLPLEEGCDIQLVVVALDPALRMFDGGLNEIFVGGTFELGGAGFDTHAFWLIDSDDPNYNPDQEAWSASFHLQDSGTTDYGDSDAFVVQFTTACNPAQALTAVCKDGGANNDKVVARIKHGRADAELTVRLDGDPATDTDLVVGDNGKGKAKFKRVADGPHQVEVMECGTTGNTTCP